MKTTEQYKMELQELNEKNGSNINLKEGVEYIGALTKIIHICTCGKEWLTTPANVLYHNNSCGLCYTFAEWGIDHLGEDFLEKYWDYDKNIYSPWELNSGSSKKRKIWIKCQEKDYHGSYETQCDWFIRGSRCSYCKGDYLVHPKDSIGQYIIETYGEKSLNLYWDYNKNTKDAFSLKKFSNKFIWIKCQEKDYHGSYKITCSDFARGFRCGYCIGKKVHALDSLGYVYPKVLNIWSDKNKISPFEVKPYSNKYIWLKCNLNYHPEYRQTICGATASGFKCPNCSMELKESTMASTLKQVLRHEYPNTIWEYDAGFKINKNKSKYDIYVPELNLLIECQSEYHDNEKQNHNDMLKKEYAINNNYNFMAIDKRKYTVLQALKIFFPNLKRIPKYVDLSVNTRITWDINKAQILLDQGFSFDEVAEKINVHYKTITSAARRGILKRPENYIKFSSQFKKVVCLTKNGEFVKQYESLAEAKREFGNKSTIGCCITGVKKTAYGYKWMYYDDYIQKFVK